MADPTIAERLARVETQISAIERNIEQRHAENRQQIEELKASLLPVTNAFQRALGVKATLWVIGALVMLALGAGVSKVFEFIVSAFKG